MNRVHRGADDLPELNQGIWRRRLLGQHSLAAKTRSQAFVEPDSDHGLRTAGAVCATGMAPPPVILAPATGIDVRTRPH
jgi:hypothetical protein